MPNLKDKDEFFSVFPEIESYMESCHFNDCIHINEPKCAIKNGVENNKISKLRYEFYKEQYLEFKERWNNYD